MLSTRGELGRQELDSLDSMVWRHAAWGARVAKDGDEKLELDKTYWPYKMLDDTS